MKKTKVFRIALSALFAALLAVMAFTPLGYIPTGAFNITLMFLPVIFGAIAIGLTAGAVLGLLFGLTSFLQAFGIGFIIDPMASVLFEISPLYYTLVCFVPRIVMGLLVGLIFKGMKRIDRTKTQVPSYAVASISAVVLNTSLFMTGYYLAYRSTALAETPVNVVIMSALSLNSLCELLVALLIGTPASMAIVHAMRKMK